MSNWCDNFNGKIKIPKKLTYLGIKKLDYIGMISNTHTCLIIAKFIFIFSSCIPIIHKGFETRILHISDLYCMARKDEVYKDKYIIIYSS